MNHAKPICGVSIVPQAVWELNAPWRALYWGSCARYSTESVRLFFQLAGLAVTPRPYRCKADNSYQKQLVMIIFAFQATCAECVTYSCSCSFWALRRGAACGCMTPSPDNPGYAPPSAYPADTSARTRPRRDKVIVFVHSVISDEKATWAYRD
jgi:hypothetical protein